jgi:hypothetical protein
MPAQPIREECNAAVAGRASICWTNGRNPHKPQVRLATAVKVPEIGPFTSTRMRALAEAEVIQAPCGSVPDLPDVTLPMA